MTDYLKNNKGFTLIELLVSVVILGIIVIPLSTYFISTAKVSNSSKKQLIANHLAQKHMEKIRGSSDLSESSVETDEQGFVIKTTVTKYETGKYSLPEGEEDSFNMIIKFERENIGELEIFDNNNNHITSIDSNSDIMMEIDSHSIKIGNGIDFREIGYTIGDADTDIIKIQFISYKDTDVNLHVFNNTNKAAEIFVVPSKESTGTINGYTEYGPVLFHKGVLDSSYSPEDRNRIYKVIVSVQENDSEEPIAKLTSLQKVIE